MERIASFQVNHDTLEPGVMYRELTVTLQHTI